MKKFDIVLVDLNPVKWSEQAWVRPCVIIQNDLANNFSKTYVVAIISTVIKNYPHTLIIEPTILNWLTSQSRIDLLQIRTIDSERIIKNIWKVDLQYQSLLNERIKIAFGL